MPPRPEYFSWIDIITGKTTRVGLWPARYLLSSQHFTGTILGSVRLFATAQSRPIKTEANKMSPARATALTTPFFTQHLLIIYIYYNINKPFVKLGNYHGMA